MTKQLDQSEGKLKCILLDNLSAEASTASIRMQCFDSDNPNVARIPDSGTLKYLIDPENTQGKPSEWIRCLSHATVDGITTLSTVTRGLQRDATVDLTGSAARAQDWDASTTPIGVATEPHNNNLMKDYFTGDEPIPGDMEFDGDLQFDGDNTFNGLNTFNGPVNVLGTSSYIHFPNLTTVQRDALTPTEGMVIFNLTDGLLNVYQGGLWQSLDTGVVTPNASTTVSGKVEIATTAESIAGTDVGGTGAFLSVLPSDIAKNTQSNTFVYAASTTGNDTYVATLVPALAAYVNGETFRIKVDTANTGACTLNVNGLGAISIKLPTGEDPQTGDIVANEILEVTYNSTGPKFVLENTPGLLTNANNGSEKHWHDFVRNNSISRRNTYSLSSGTNYYAKTSLGADNLGTLVMSTAAANNDWSGRAVAFTDNTAKLNANALSVHNKNPSFRVTGSFNAATAQEGFIGFIDLVGGGGWANAGTSLENSVMIINHVGFIVEDGTLYISVADGTTQSKTNISATVPSVTAGHIWEVYFDGTTATYFVDNVSVGTLNTNVPTSNLNAWFALVMTDVSAASKTFYLQKSGWITHNEV